MEIFWHGCRKRRLIDMKRERGSIKKYYPQIKEMHEQGICAQDIADVLGMERTSIHNAIANLGLAQKRNYIDETKLIYAEKKEPVLEKVIIDGKVYTDITQLFIPI